MNYTTFKKFFLIIILLTFTSCNTSRYIIKTVDGSEEVTPFLKKKVRIKSVSSSKYLTVRNGNIILSYWSENDANNQTFTLDAVYDASGNPLYVLKHEPTEKVVKAGEIFTLDKFQAKPDYVFQATLLVINDKKNLQFHKPLFNSDKNKTDFLKNQWTNSKGNPKLEKVINFDDAFKRTQFWQIEIAPEIITPQSILGYSITEMSSSGLPPNVEKYAPVLFFDSEQGDDDHNFPTNAYDYYSKAKDRKIFYDNNPKEAEKAMMVDVIENEVNILGTAAEGMKSLFTSKSDKKSPIKSNEELAKDYAAKEANNFNYENIKNGTIPTYVQYWEKELEVTSIPGQNLPSPPDKIEYIQYWFFYSYQPPCCITLGAHNGDWERIGVKIVNDELIEVMFFQHGGWYVKKKENIEMITTHPKVYVGKNSHGSYHDTGGEIGCFGCLYFGDYRKPGDKPKSMPTWSNLVLCDSVSSWMSDTQFWENYTTGNSPLTRNDIQLIGKNGCDEDGCDKSDLPSNVKW